jgi:hypothetical protein
MAHSLEKALSLFFFAHLFPLPPIDDDLTDAFDKTVQVGPITLAQQATLPGVDCGDDIRQESQGIVGWQDGEAQKITKGDQGEQALYLPSLSLHAAHPLVGGRSIDEFCECVRDAA